MLVLDANATASALDYSALIAGLREMFAAGVTAPLRHAHGLPRAGEPDATLLVMPAWMGDGSHGGVKIVNVVPGNAKRGLAAVTASYLLFDETTGAHMALMDGATLTGRRTAAASALAASYLARPDARTLLVVGAGHIGSEMPEAYQQARRISQVSARCGIREQAITYDKLGILYLLALLPEDKAVTRLRDRFLAPLQEYDQKHKSALCETLRVYLHDGASYKSAGEKLNLHFNSVKYRVLRAEDRRGRPIGEDRLDVELALLLCHWYGTALLAAP